MIIPASGWHIVRRSHTMDHSEIDSLGSSTASGSRTDRRPQWESPHRGQAQALHVLQALLAVAVVQRVLMQRVEALGRL